MRYLVRARVKPGQEAALRQAIEERTLGQGSIAGGEYLRNMAQARLIEDSSVRWVEVCYCRLPLEEERPYWVVIHVRFVHAVCSQQPLCLAIDPGLIREQQLKLTRSATPGNS